MCKVARKSWRERAKEFRAQHRAAAKREIAAMRERDRASCAVGKVRAATQGVDFVVRAEQRLQAERAQQRTLRLYSKPARLKGSSSSSRRRSASAIHESDSEVIANIPHELEPVWRSVRTRIKESPRRTRTEAFLERVQEHPGEVLAIQERQFTADVERAYREQAELERKVRRPRAYRVRDDDPELGAAARMLSQLPPAPF